MPCTVLSSCLMAVSTLGSTEDKMAQRLTHCAHQLEVQNLLCR